LFTGAAIGLAQNAGALSHRNLRIAKTVVGLGASSLGAKLDVEMPEPGCIVTLGFYLVHQAVYFTVARGMVNLTLNWSWKHDLLAASRMRWWAWHCTLCWTSLSRGRDSSSQFSVLK